MLAPRRGPGYFGYFGAAAGDPAKGDFTDDLGSWHVAVLNSNCGVGCCANDLTQVELGRAPTLPRTRAPARSRTGITRGSSWSQLTGTTPAVAAPSDILHAGGADLVLDGDARTPASGSLRSTRTAPPEPILAPRDRCRGRRLRSWTTLTGIARIAR